MRKSTYQAFSDVAFIKYWGKKDAALRLPENGSISMILEGLETITTVEFIPGLEQDELSIASEKLPSENREVQRVTKHLDRVRSLADTDLRAKVASENSFPRGTGLSSSGSGFAALTYAALGALDISLTEKEISILARQGSGSAARCVLGGYVEWKAGNSSDTSFAEEIAPESHWDLRDVVAVTDEGAKKMSSTKGHSLARTSPFYGARQKNITEKLNLCREAIAEKDFSRLGAIIEDEALEFHSIIFTSKPSNILWYPGSLQVMHAVRQLREEGIECYFTLNTGFNVHVITTPENEAKVQNRLEELPLIKKTIAAKTGGRPRELEKHLF